MPRSHPRALKAATTVVAAAVPLVAALAGPGRSPGAAPQQVLRAQAEDAPVQGKKVVVQEKVEGFFVQPGAVNGLGGNVDQAVQNMVLRLGPILRVELRVLTLAADPTPEQRRAIAVEAGRALKEYARNQMGGNAVPVAAVALPQPAPAVALKVEVVPEAKVAVKAVPAPALVAPAPVAPAPVAPVVIRRQPANARVDARKLIRDAVEAAARAQLDPERLARYQDELDRKVRDRREVVLLNMVAKLDQLLALGDDQRDRLTVALRTHWDDRMFPTVETVNMYDQSYPMIQDPLILPVLSDEQQRIWRAAPKINFASVRFNNQAVGTNLLTKEELERDADLKAALAPEEKP